MLLFATEIAHIGQDTGAKILIGHLDLKAHIDSQPVADCVISTFATPAQVSADCKLRSS